MTARLFLNQLPPRSLATAPLTISHSSRHYSDLPSAFFLLFNYKFQYVASHTSIQAHYATLKTGQFIPGGQKDTKKLSILEHYTAISGITKPLPVQGFGQNTLRALCSTKLRRANIAREGIPDRKSAAGKSTVNIIYVLIKQVLKGKVQYSQTANEPVSI